MPVVYVDLWIYISLLRCLLIASVIWAVKNILHESIPAKNFFAAVFCVFIYSLAERYGFEVKHTLIMSSWWVSIAVFSLIISICLARVRAKLLFISYFLAFYILSAGVPLIINGFLAYFGRGPLEVWQASLWEIAGVYVIAEIGWGIVHQKFISRDFWEITVCFPGGKHRFKALLDNGNRLYDPVTQKPVIVVAKEKIAGILPEQWRKLLEQAGPWQDFKIEPDDEWASRFSLVPYGTINKNSGFIYGWRADYVELEREGNIKVFYNPVIAAADVDFSGQPFEALLPAGIVNNARITAKTG